MTLSGARIHITGIVQGVGFRPFIFGLATRLGLTGWVRNTSAGVDIQVDGTTELLQSFITNLRKDTPPLARIDDLSSEQCLATGFTSFTIIHSEPVVGAFQPISPDVSICPDCLKELLDPKDRRYRYPFINCTNCGPRFTIITDIPYDRPNTTMAPFKMCPDCQVEYENPLDRRFHAQPVACPNCGPEVWLESYNQESMINEQDHSIINPPTPTTQLSEIARGDHAIRKTQLLLSEGKVVAIKGLGGFHLACDATNTKAVATLRERKQRVDKPFALMMPDLETIEAHCYISTTEREWLQSRQRPIVILQRRVESNISPEVAPQQKTLGVMLPYTPLHYLLLSNSHESHLGDRPLPTVLVMTSGNLSEEPIATDNDEARQRLFTLADAFLLHDRSIHTRCDDSVVREGLVESGSGSSKTANIMILRRSRGFAPTPLQLSWNMPPLLATGAELKNTFCLTHDQYAFLSHHIGDLENYETLRSFEEGIAQFEHMFRVQPEAIAYDLHPNYLSTRYALSRCEKQNLPALGVQHHHAHIAACMAENGLEDDQPVIGVAFDGTGYGDDGAIWGGEFLLVGNYPKIGRSDQPGEYRRVAHLSYVPLPGGDMAIRNPARIALAHLWQAGLEWEPELTCVSTLSNEERLALHTQLENRLNTPLTSSMGRLFDAVASLAGIRQQVNYEAQAAIELETIGDPDETGSYELELHTEDQVIQIDPTHLIRNIVQELHDGASLGQISTRFHNSVVKMVLEICLQLKKDFGINKIALSGGVWQNMTLFRKTVQLLVKNSFNVYYHRLVPPNDGGLALGQAVVAARRLECA